MLMPSQRASAKRLGKHEHECELKNSVCPLCVVRTHIYMSLAEETQVSVRLTYAVRIMLKSAKSSQLTLTPV